MNRTTRVNCWSVEPSARGSSRARREAGGLQTVVGIAITSNTKYVAAPGNVLLPAAHSGLPRDSVANVTQLVTVDERYLNERAGRIPRRLMRRVDEGLLLVLDL